MPCPGRALSPRHGTVPEVPLQSTGTSGAGVMSSPAGPFAHTAQVSGWLVVGRWLRLALCSPCGNPLPV